MAETEYDPEDMWTDQWLNAVRLFSTKVAELNRTNPWPHIPLLPTAITALITELWDDGFSSTQIREAFEAAVSKFPIYTGGRERP